jgi:hypothetical protein
MVEQKDGKKRVTVSLECEILKAENAAEDHISQLFMPKLSGMDVVGMSRFEICFSLVYVYVLYLYWICYLSRFHVYLIRF